MSKKDNFSQAMYEMFGLGKAPEAGDDELDELDDLNQLENLRAAAEEDPFESAPEPAAPVVEKAAFREPAAPELTPVEPQYVPEPVAAPAPAPAAEQDFFSGLELNTPVNRGPNCTYFAEGTSMEGTLRSDSDIEIVGDFKGEIASDGKVTIHSNTTSSIAAAELILIDCTLTGDAMVSGDVSVNERSSITGNVRASNIVCSGLINGNLIIKENITLTENARIVGDIKTGTLTMARGAKVSGKIDMGS